MPALAPAPHIVKAIGIVFSLRTFSQKKILLIVPNNNEFTRDIINNHHGYIGGLFCQNRIPRAFDRFIVDLWVFSSIGTIILIFWSNISRGFLRFKLRRLMYRWGGEMAWIHGGHGNLQKRTDI